MMELVPLPRNSMRAFFRNPVAFARESGDASVLWLAAGPARSVLVRDPDAIWRILVTDSGSFRQGKWKRRARRYLGPTLNTLDGEEHRQRRLLLQPALDRRRLAAIASAIVVRAERTQADWADGARIVLRDELERLSLAMAGDALLSTDLERDADRLAEALRTVMASVARFRPPLPGTPQARALADVHRVLDRIVGERRLEPRANGDLVSRLLSTDLPESVVRGELTAFLVAAADEPPSALEAAWYLLGRSPAAEERLRTELVDVLGDHPATIEDAARLPYLNAVIHESLRLLPPARYVDRRPVRRTSLAGRSISPHTNVLVSPLVTHRDPGLWAAADDFLPERWLGAGAVEPDRRGTFLPFGAGAHTCIGEPLARMIVGLSLATVARRWRLRVDPDAPEPSPHAPRLVVTLERQ